MPQGDASVDACGTACDNTCWCVAMSFYAPNRHDPFNGKCFGYPWTAGATQVTTYSIYDIACSMAPGSIPKTCPPTPIPTPSPASGTGDPHLQNVHGQRFDLMKPGTHVLVNIPKGEVQQALLRVSADARRLGGHCADMYFLNLNVTGAWAEQKHAGGCHYDSEGVINKTPEWAAFGPVQLKVVPGRTEQGIRYLNFYVKSLGRAGMAVGGLLGDDDHSDAARAPAACGRRVVLTGMDDHSFSESSIAVASF